MFTIGDFAKLGRVSVRMLRHYDAIGLLTPAAVDPASGYRFYDAGQLRRLNRIIALKDLGFTLQQVGAILDEKLGADELRGMLRLRRAQLEAQLSADATRLAGVEARLRMIEKEGHMNTEDVVLKEVAPVRVAELSAVAASYEPADIEPVITPLFDELIRRLESSTVAMTGPPIAYYESTEAGEPITVHAAMPTSTDTGAHDEFALVDLPRIRHAATMIHHGGLADADQTVQTLAQWIEDNGYRMVGYAREVYLQCPPGEFDKWVTEFQVEVARA